MRGGYTSGSGCSRFYFTFNGGECATPGRIDHLHYISQQKNMHRSSIGAVMCSYKIYNRVTVMIKHILKYANDRHNMHVSKTVTAW